MKKLANRQGSSASSDTYHSCNTHLQSSPSNYDVTPDAPHQNVYAIPTDPQAMQLGVPSGYSYTPAFSFDNNNSTNNLPTTFSKNSNRNVHKPGVGSDGRSVSPKQHKSPALRTRLRDGPAASALRQLFKNKKQKSHVPPPPRLGETDKNHSHSSNESMNSQGAVRPMGSPRYRRAPFGRGHASPGTRKKLANYHLIANSQSGKYMSLYLCSF